MGAKCELAKKLSEVLDKLKRMNAQAHELYAQRTSAQSSRSRIGQRPPGSGGRGSGATAAETLAGPRGGGRADRVCRPAPGARGARIDAAAAGRGVIRQAGRRKAPRPRADRGGHLRGDQVRPAPLLGGRAGSDADPARHGGVPRAPIGRGELPNRRSGDARRSTSPTGATTCATCSITTGATRCWRWPRTTQA